MNAPAPIETIYTIDSLVSAFNEALTAKQEKVTAFFAKNPTADWARNWPDGNTVTEQFVVDWLKAQADNGATQIKTVNPISGNGPVANPHHSLYMQIRAGHAYAVI
ncbi:MAG: hypothetical protein ACXW4B_11755 [Micavibrio sp.]